MEQFTNKLSRFFGAESDKESPFDTMPPIALALDHCVSARTWWVAFAAVAATLLVPLFLTEIPPLLDYPNHLARMEILAHGADDPALSRIYATHWRVVPNIGIDATMPALMRLLPLGLAGKFFLALALLLPMAGVAALHRAIFRTTSYWPLAAALVAYNRLFFAGFLNFLIGVGLALLAASLWEVQRDRKAWARVATASLAALLIFFCHLIAVAFYGLLLLSLELARAWQDRRLEIKRLILLAIPFLIPAALYLSAPISQAGGWHGLINAIKHYYWALAASPLWLKLYGLMGPFMTYDRLLDAAALVLMIVTLTTLLPGRQLRVAPAMIGAFALLLIAYPFVPFFIMETAWVDQRLPILAGFLLFSGTLPIIRTRRTAALMAAAFAVVIVARTAEIGQAWIGHDSVLADFRHVIAPVMPGDRVLVVQPEDNMDPAAMINQPHSVRSMRENDSTMHLPALLVIERKAFWPYLFTAPFKQPVRVLPPYDTISHETPPPWIGALAEPTGTNLEYAPYLTDWPKKFDWVLVLRPDEAPDGHDLLPNRLEKAADGKIAALYRVRR